MKYLIILLSLFIVGCSNLSKERVYYSNGNLKSEISTDNNSVKNGPILNYFEDGRVAVKGYFKDDKREYKEIIEDQKIYFISLLQKPYVFMNVNKGEPVNFTFATSREKFIENVKQAKEYIKAGDIFQVVLSQRMYCETEKTPFEIYRNLRAENPSP